MDRIAIYLDNGSYALMHNQEVGLDASVLFANTYENWERCEEHACGFQRTVEVNFGL